MNPQQWQVLGELFDQAIVLPVGERTALVDRACGEDEELRGELASLIASHQAAGGFLQDRLKHAFASFLETSVVGTQLSRVGPYRLVRELGRGGMGTVFLAERDDDQYQARVAVKLVRPGMDTEFILERFRRERQTLARLQHPNICRLLDGGTTDSGLPYIVMEFIEGRWLTQFVRERELDVRARLRLFLDVCSAVDYAHRHFIVHRDLKPGNILVDADGIPKLLDFGICKLLRSDGVTGDETVDLMLTPNYASPEQLRGDAATPLSDVYALGTVLYELLTGRCPRSFEGFSWANLESILRTPILPPSAAVDNRHTTRLLRGDLDNVLLRALAAEPEWRYQSPAELADDLQRYLDHEPVSARRPSIRYRAAKFLRRNRVAVIAATLVISALVAGLAAAISQARVAHSRQAQIRNLSNRLVFDVYDAVRDLPGATRASKLIVQTGLEYLDSSFQSVAGDPRAERELATAYRRLGDVQGNVRTQNLGDLPSALASYQKAISLLEGNARSGSTDPEADTERLRIFDRIAAIQAFTGKLTDALRTLETGIKTGTTLAATGGVDLQAALADLYIDASENKRNLGDYRGALSDANESARFFRGLVTLRPVDPELRHSLATALASIGMAESSLGQLQPALDHFREGTAEMEKLVAADAHNVPWSRDLMVAYGHIGDVLGYPDLQNLGDRRGALEAYRTAAEIGRTLHVIDPADLRAATDLGIALSRIENTMDEQDWSARRDVQLESLRVLDEAASISPENTTIKLYQALVRQHLGDALTRGGDEGSARNAFEASAAIAEAGAKTGNRSFVAIFMLAKRRLAVSAALLGQRAEALEHARTVLRTGEPSANETHPAIAATPRGLSAMGLTYAALFRSRVSQPADLEEARAWLTKALDAWRSAQSDPTFGAPHRREMREVETALASLRTRG